MNPGDAAKLIIVLQDIADSIARTARAAEDTARWTKTALDKLDRMAGPGAAPADLSFSAPVEAPAPQLTPERQEEAARNLESVLLVNRALAEGAVRVGASGLVELSQP
jgi:hypothetical protein